MENVRCIMAGDTYSFVIENFQEKNLGRYSITAENSSGKATCSAQVLFEGSESTPQHPQRRLTDHLPYTPITGQPHCQSADSR